MKDLGIVLLVLIGCDVLSYLLSRIFFKVNDL